MKKRFPTRTVAAGILGVLALVMILVRVFQKKPSAADLVLLGGDICAVDASTPRARALVVRGNVIEAVLPSDAEAMAYVGRKTEVLELNGAFVLAGVIGGP